MKKDLIYELDKKDSVSSLQENKLYKYDIEKTGIADYLVFKKDNDKIICCNARYSKDNNLKFSNLTPDNDFIEYCVINYNSVEKETIEGLHEKILERYKEFNKDYLTMQVDNDFFIYKSNLNPNEISINDMSSELNMKYFPIEIKEISSKIIYVKDKDLDSAIEKAESFIDDRVIELDKDSKSSRSIKEYREHSFFVNDKLEDYKNNTLRKEDLTYYEAFKSIYGYNYHATDEEVTSIASSAYDAWLKDDGSLSITNITDFLSDNYFYKEITLDDIENATPRDIISDVADDMVYCIKKEDKDKDEEMER